MVDLADEVLRGIDKSGEYASLCAIDFTKALDRMNHNMTVKKLIDIGVRQIIIPVICSFLTNRTQAVFIQGSSFSPLFVWGGVPQGTKGTYFGPKYSRLWQTTLHLMLLSDGRMLTIRP